MKDVKLERWEDNEYILEINGKPFGSTVTKLGGQIIFDWLKTCPEMNRQDVNCTTDEVKK